MGGVSILLPASLARTLSPDLSIRLQMAVSGLAPVARTLSPDLSQDLSQDLSPDRCPHHLPRHS